jgi:lipopolysaccharide/colanic/teichoic acid biosynthesis glycosyltransferase
MKETLAGTISRQERAMRADTRFMATTMAPTELLPSTARTQGEPTTMNGQQIVLTDAVSYRSAGLPVWKRVLDVAIIIVLLPGLVLLGLTVAVIVKLGSPGPILFRQRRVGYRGQEFTCLKFRTMNHKADTEFHEKHTQHLIKSQVPMTKLDGKKDPRVVPFGTALRATGLDELPQLINVLRGEMSIVGPRPCLPCEAELYQPWHRRRFNAVPGLTGLWQVSGKNRTTFNQMVQLDIEYSERLNLFLDLQIIAKTLPALWVQCRDTQAQRRNEALNS